MLNRIANWMPGKEYKYKVNIVLPSYKNDQPNTFTLYD